MYIKAYKNELEQLKSDGVSAIDKMISSGYQENFYFDFKNIATKDTDLSLNNDDRKNLAKAISGFSNTSGGLIIWGITDNQNNTFSKNPINFPDKFMGLINDSVSKLSLPVMSGIDTFVIKDTAGKGYVVTEVPKYYFSPVQVNPSLNIKDIPGRYYIRSGSDFVVANHDMISSLYNRHEQSEMVCQWAVSDTGSYEETDDQIKCRISLILRNKGSAVLRDVWINYTAGGVKTSLEQTQQISVFTGWNIFGHGINLITNDGFKLGPQQTLSPFLIEIIIPKKDITKGACIYFSFGADRVAPNEWNFFLTEDKLNSFLLEQNRSSSLFIKHFFNTNES